MRGQVITEQCLRAIFLLGSAGPRWAGSPGLLSMPSGRCEAAERSTLAPQLHPKVPDKGWWEIAPSRTFNWHLFFPLKSIEATGLKAFKAQKTLPSLRAQTGPAEPSEGCLPNTHSLGVPHHSQVGGNHGPPLPWMVLINAEHGPTWLHTCKPPPLYGHEPCQCSTAPVPSSDSFIITGALLFNSFWGCRRVAPLLGHLRSAQSSQDSLALSRMSPLRCLGPSPASLPPGIHLADVGQTAWSLLLTLRGVSSGAHYSRVHWLVASWPPCVKGPSEPPLRARTREPIASLLSLGNPLPLPSLCPSSPAREGGSLGSPDLSLTLPLPNLYQWNSMELFLFG